MALRAQKTTWPKKRVSKVKQKPKPKSNHSNRSKSHGPEIGKTTKNTTHIDHHGSFWPTQ